MGLAKVKRSYIARHIGSVSRGVPRISNLDKGIEIVGYTEVNTQATSVLGRVKIHKGYFYCGEGQVAEGDLVLDKRDTNYYLVMSSKIEQQGYEVIYYDSTLIHCQEQITICRFGDGIRDSFGRVISDAPQVIAENVWTTSNPQNFTVTQQEDRLVPQDKIAFYVQRKVGVQPADRIITPSAENFVVLSVDKRSLDGIDILYVDLDVR